LLRVQVASTYFKEFLTRGNGEVASEIFADDVVHTDVIWDPVHPTVGVLGLQHYIHDLKLAFPDFWVLIKEIAVCEEPAAPPSPLAAPPTAAPSPTSPTHATTAGDTNSIWVSYEGSATGLGEYHGHKGSHHANVFSGVNLLRFTADRSRIAEVQVYRSAFAEDKEELRERVPEGGFRELRLRRLV
jgi:hypothetical protein